MLHYDFSTYDQAIGSDINEIVDLTGNGYNLLPKSTGRSTLQLNKHGMKCLRMLGRSTDAYISPHAHTINQAASATLIASYNRITHHSTLNQGIYIIGFPDSANARGFDIRLQTSGDLPYSRMGSAITTSNTDSRLFDYPDGSLNDVINTHAGIYKGSGLAHQLWWDGQSRSSSNRTGLIQARFGEIVMGTFSSASTNNTYLNGEINEIIVFDYAIPDAELIQILSDLKAKWTPGPTITDVTDGVDRVFYPGQTGIQVIGTGFNG